ncbi:MAG TPA: hypothetical protein VL125_03360 [Pelobium sp.]|nr:hypothetical protein [Pelobium sp.]
MDKTKKAVIDIGTNTFHLLIATVDEDNNIDIIYKNTIAVKLGEGGETKVLLHLKLINEELMLWFRSEKHWTNFR